jgi:hypothetical protein
LSHLEIGPAMFPSYLFFVFIKARERRRAAWNLSRLIGKPLREIGMIISHDVELGCFGELPMVYGEHAVHLSYLFMGTKLFGNHLLYSRRCRQLQLGFVGLPRFMVKSYTTGRHLVCPVLDAGGLGRLPASQSLSWFHVRNQVSQVIRVEIPRVNQIKRRKPDRHARFSGLIVALPSTVGLIMKRPSDTLPSPLRLQAADALRRARKLPVGHARNDLRQLAIGLLWLEKKNLKATVQDPVTTILALTDLRSEAHLHGRQNADIE